MTLTHGGTEPNRVGPDQCAGTRLSIAGTLRRYYRRLPMPEASSFRPTPWVVMTGYPLNPTAPALKSAHDRRAAVLEAQATAARLDVVVQLRGIE